MKDPRVVVAEVAVELLKEVPQKFLRKIDLRTLSAEIKTLSFSFMSLEELSDQGMLENVTRFGDELKEVYLSWKDKAKAAGERLALSKVRFAHIILSNLPERVGRARELFYGTDSYWGKLIMVDEFNGLRDTLIESKGRFHVVTNLNVTEGDILAFAILPPRRFGDHISEGMFFEAEGEGRPGDQAIPTERGKRSVEAVLREEASRLNIKI